MSNEQETTTLDEWAKVELFGHQVLIGRVTKADFGEFIRCDVHNSDGSVKFTKFLNPKAIYAISPITKGLALMLSGRYGSEPVHAFDLPRPTLPPAESDSGPTDPPEDDDADEYIPFSERQRNDLG